MPSLRKYNMVFEEAGQPSAMRPKLDRPKIRSVSISSTNDFLAQVKSGLICDVRKSPRAPEYEVVYVKTKTDGPKVKPQHKVPKPPKKDAPDTKDDKDLSEMGGLKVIACNKHDGLYYPGHVGKTSSSTYALVTFNFKKKQKVSTRNIIPLGGAVSRPELALGDFALVQVYNQFKNIECFVPAIVEFVPEDFRSPNRFYTMLLYNGQRETTLRRNVVKIGGERFKHAVSYIHLLQQNREARQTGSRNRNTRRSSSPGSVNSEETGSVRSERSHTSISTNASTDSKRRKKKEKYTKKLVKKTEEEKGKKSRKSRRSARSSSRSQSRSRSRSQSYTSRSGSRSSSGSRSRKSSARSRNRSASRSSSRSRSRRSKLGGRSRTKKSARSDSRGTSRSRSRSRSGRRSRTKRSARSDSRSTSRSRRRSRSGRRSRTKRSARSDSRSTSRSRSRSQSGNRSKRKTKSNSVSRSRSREVEKPRRQSKHKTSSRSESSRSRSRSPSPVTLEISRAQQTPVKRSRSKWLPRSGSRSRSGSRTPRNHSNDDSGSTTPRQSPIDRPENPVPMPRPSDPIPRSDSLAVTRTDIYLENNNHSSHVHSHSHNQSRDPSRNSNYSDKDQMIDELQYKLEKQQRKQMRQERRLIRQARKINRIQQKLKDGDSQNNSLRSDRSKSRQDSESSFMKTPRAEEGKYRDISDSENRCAPDTETSRVRRSAINLPENTEVLARWSDDGWYYVGVVFEQVSHDRYIIEDSTGHREVINRQDILTEDEHCGTIQPNDYVIGLHPNFEFSYCPGKVAAVYRDDTILVKFYDGKDATLTYADAYKIPMIKCKKDMEYIIECENKLVGRDVVARDDESGEYKLGMVERHNINQQRGIYVVRLTNGHLVDQKVNQMFDIRELQTEHDGWQYVLAPTDLANTQYLPARVIQTVPFTIQLCTMDRPVSVSKNKCFWINKQFYRNAVDFYSSKHHML